MRNDLTSKIVFIVCALVLLSYAPWASANETVQMEAEFIESFESYRKSAESSDWNSALKHIKKAYQISGELYGDTHIKRAEASLFYGKTLVSLWRRVPSRKYFYEALDIAESHYGQKSEHLIPYLIAAASGEIQIFKRGKEIGFYTRAIKLSRKTYGKKSRKYAEINARVGLELLGAARNPSGLKYLRRATSIMGKWKNATDQERFKRSFYDATVALVTNKQKKAENRLVDTIALAESTEIKAQSKEFLIASHTYLVKLYEESNRGDEATKHCIAVAQLSPESKTEMMLPIYRAAPYFPKDALQDRTDGWVDLTFDVDESGRTKKHKITDSSGYGSFHRAAILAAKRYRYPPRLHDGKPQVAHDVKIRITFEIGE